MRSKFILLLAAIVLSGCAEVITGNDKGGVIEGDGWAMSGANLFPKAETYCARYNKKAKVLTSNPSGRFTPPSLSFECVG